MTALDDALRATRAAALRTERASHRAILAAWQATYARLQPYITAAIAQARAVQADTPAGASFAVPSLPTVRALATALQTETRQFAVSAALTVAAGQHAATRDAPALAERAILAALGTPPPGAVVPALARAGLFTPNDNAAQIAAIIARLAPGMGDAGAKAIADGVRAGRGARQIARDVRLAANVAPVRALTIARHAVNEGFRRSTLETLRANAAYLEGWVWYCAQSRRTCAACWAKHGSFHTLDERMGTHVCCRCAMVPRTKSWVELGFPGVPDTRPEIRHGAALFTELPAEDQRYILGAGKYEKWFRGSLQLSDLVGETFSPVYGPGMREKSLRELQRAG